ncbi:MAG: pilus assembly protein [Alphaproteobacteria bacterium]|nr:pilus assembly protein [Alphaproteobacteria bacterium]
MSPLLLASRIMNRGHRRRQARVCRQPTWIPLHGDSGAGSLACRVRARVADCRGATAIEIALILPVLLPILLAIFEVGLMFFASVLMDGAASDAARLVRTGQAQRSADALGTFRQRLCDQLFGVVNCGDVMLDVRSFRTFGAIPPTVQLDDQGRLANVGFTPGNAGDIIIVRVGFRWNFSTPLIGLPFSDNGTNSRLLLSTVVFRNEPYQRP